MTPAELRIARLREVADYHRRMFRAEVCSVACKGCTARFGLAALLYLISLVERMPELRCSVCGQPCIWPECSSCWESGSVDGPGLPEMPCPGCSPGTV